MFSCAATPLVELNSEATVDVLLVSASISLVSSVCSVPSGCNAMPMEARFTALVPVPIALLIVLEIVFLMVFIIESPSSASCELADESYDVSDAAVMMKLLYAVTKPSIAVF